MKKCIIIILICCITLTFASCTADNFGGTQSPPPIETPTPTHTQSIIPTSKPTGAVSQETREPVFEGKIAILTSNDPQAYGWHTEQQVIDKYGENKNIQVPWPSQITESIYMIKALEKLGENLDIKAIIVTSPIPGTNAAFEKLKETRKDIFIVYCKPEESAADITQTANLILKTDELGMGSAMVRQAQKLGTKAFVHYFLPRHKSQNIFSKRYDLIKQECEKLDMEFVDATCLEPMDVGMANAQQFIIEDVLKMVEKYGKDTAFFCTNCALQPPLIKAVVETGAIYPQPCCPSPDHGFPTALGIGIPDDYSSPPSVEYYIAETKAALTNKDMLGRLSTWPVEDSFMYTAVSAEYAVKWINGEVPKEGVDVEVLKQLMENYAGVPVCLTPYTDEYPYTDEGTGKTYDNFLMMRMDYLTFE